MKEGHEMATKILYTVKDIAEQLQVNEKTARRLFTTGKLPAAKLCGKWVDTLKAFVDSQAEYKQHKGASSRLLTHRGE